jgi:hypothetical protein
MATVAPGTGDFPIERPLWWVTIAEAVILAVGGFGLLLAPELISQFWPWPLGPYTERALGAVYASAFVVVASLAIRPWWSPARIVVPMVATFTVIVSVLSIAGIDHLTNWPWTGVWLVVYLAAAAVALWYLWRSRGTPPASSALPPGRWLRWALVIEVVVLGGYGVALLGLGSSAADFWPWAVGGVYRDDFVARVYSAAFLTPAVGAALLVRVGTPHEDRTLGASQVVSGVAAVTGLLVADASLHRVDWTRPGTWLWLAFPVAIAAVGLLLLRGRRA